MGLGATVGLGAAVGAGAQEPVKEKNTLVPFCPYGRVTQEPSTGTGSMEGRPHWVQVASVHCPLPTILPLLSHDTCKEKQNHHGQHKIQNSTEQHKASHLVVDGVATSNVQLAALPVSEKYPRILLRAGGAHCVGVHLLRDATRSASHALRRHTLSLDV